MINGFQAGISYTPTDNQFFEPTPKPTSEIDGWQKDIIGLGSQWNGDFGGTTVGFSAVGAISDGATNEDPDKSREGLGYYEPDRQGRLRRGRACRHVVGLRRRQRDQGVDQELKGWALDASYAFGPYGIEVQYAHAERSTKTPATMTMDNRAKMQSSDFDGWNVSLGYSIAPGLKWYGEVNRGTFDVMGNDPTTQDPDGKYSGTVFLSGLYLNF